MENAQDYFDDIYLSERYPNEDERRSLSQMFEDFKTEIYDYEASKNVLDGNKEVTDVKSMDRYFKRALRDLNSGVPISNYKILNFPDKGLLVEGAVIFFLISNGLLQLRNQMDYNDAGLSIALFNKTGQYQNWAQMMYSMYSQNKAQFKQTELTRLPNAGFQGVASEFMLYNGWEDELW